MGSETIRTVVADFAKSLPAGTKILDVGCGLQPYKPLFAHATYLGIDVEASGRQAKDKAADVYFDGTHIPLETESVDAVLCTEVLEHAVDPEMLTAEMFRVLRPGGRVCITVPFIWGLHEVPYDFRRFTPFGLARLFSGHGFIVDRQEKLTSGIDAIQMLINSEVNNYVVNVLPSRHMTHREAKWFRFKLRLHERLLRIMDRLWRSTLNFERIYIDNLLIAHKD